MKHYLHSNQFNVAPGAAKHLPFVWAMLACCAGLFAASLFPLSQELGQLREAKSQQLVVTKSLRRDAAEQRKQIADQSNSAAQERDKIKTQIQESVLMSWDGIFGALEAAADTVNAGVSILSLVPSKVNGMETQLNITALAANVPIMLAYMEALKKDPRVTLVEMSTQQPEERAGPSVIRFRLAVHMNPRIRVSTQATDVSTAATLVGR